MRLIPILGPCPGVVALGLLLASGFEPRPLAAAEYHVAITGRDSGDGTDKAPLRTIQAAADRAQPGDTITVHAGIYRERINPPRGGESPERRIVYRAAPGEKVEIRGSEEVRNWAREKGDVWKTTVPESLFGGSNPFRELIRGDWFDRRGRFHHTGAVYLDGQWLAEAARRDDLFQPVGEDPLWFAEAGAETTEIWAQFKGVDPNTRQVEVNVRRTVFYPDRPGRNYITVRGFVLRHAATPWAPPTAEQVGLIGTHWSRGWIIESNVVSHSVCSGIALGKHGDRWDNTSADTAEGYVKTIERALAQGWNRETIGHHVVRNNEVSHCEQAGIVGSLGAAFSEVSGNTLHDIHVRRLFSGAEMAGIKLHAAIDTTLRGNHIHHTVRGLWLDWMAQGTRVTGNLFHDNAAEDLFMEVNHGPCLVDNNLFLSRVSLLDMSEGGAFAHNLFGGRIISRPEPGRETPYHPAHATVMAGLKTVRGGDNRFYNNLFLGPGTRAGSNLPVESRDAHHAAGYGLWMYDERPLPSFAAGNVHLFGARPYVREIEPLVVPEVESPLQLVREAEGWFLRFLPGIDLSKAPTRPVTSALLGEALVPRLPYRAPDDSELRVDRDYQGRTRSATRPVPGPFEGGEWGRVRVW